MVQRIAMAPQGPEFSRFVMGYWRLMDWNMSARRWSALLSSTWIWALPPSITPIFTVIIVRGGLWRSAEAGAASA
jgi:hypothetical protein